MIQTIGEMSGSLRGQRVLVAGGEGEIGSVISETLAADGADVAIAGIELGPCKEVAERLATKDNRTAAYQFDITDPSSVDSLATDLTELWGGIDVLVNCVGILSIGPSDQFDAAQFRKVVDINLNGAFLISQAAGRMMIKGGSGGRIVHLTSVRAILGLNIGGWSAYGASKAGVHLLVKQLATEWGPHQISVNAVGSGFVRTALNAALLQNQDFASMVAARTPLGRVSEIQEVANAAVYFASPPLLVHHRSDPLCRRWPVRLPVGRCSRKARR
jgi:NAD(P)-dependent dehydrogenase (short-subunit alcohol dehydrogenase family)